MDGLGVYVVGTTNGALPGQTAHGQNDVFVRKYDPAGNYLWTRQFGTTARTRATGWRWTGRGCMSSAPPPVRCRDRPLAAWTMRSCASTTLRATTSGPASSAPAIGTTAGGVAVDGSGVYVVGTTRDALPGQTARLVGCVCAQVRSCGKVAVDPPVRNPGRDWGYGGGGGRVGGVRHRLHQRCVAGAETRPVGCVRAQVQVTVPQTAGAWWSGSAQHQLMGLDTRLSGAHGRCGQQRLQVYQGEFGRLRLRQSHTTAGASSRPLRCSGTVAQGSARSSVVGGGRVAVGEVEGPRRQGPPSTRPHPRSVSRG